jgi:hypothetical protein
MMLGMRFRPRFSLKVLLATVTVCALCSWVYFSIWPAWRLTREEADFEASVKQIKAGMTQSAAGKLLRWKTCLAKGIGAGTTPTGEMVMFGMYSWSNACYCICYILPPPKDGQIMAAPCARVEVYRLPPVPDNYQSQMNSIGGDPLSAYVWDFQSVIYEKRPLPSLPSYELIYSDPPMKPSAGSK